MTNEAKKPVDVLMREWREARDRMYATGAELQAARRALAEKEDAYADAMSYEARARGYMLDGIELGGGT